MTDNRGVLPVDFDLTCWYINRRRVLELVGNDALSGGIRTAQDQGGSDHLQKLAELVAFKDAVTQWMQRHSPPTLGQLLIHDDIQPGALFTHYTNWFCRGLPQVAAALARAEANIAPALAYASLEDLRQGWRIECGFHHEHLTSQSSWNQLSGQKRLLILGLITDLKGATINAVPYVIANPLPAFDRPQSLVGRHWFTRLEIYTDMIESFAAIKDVRPARSARNLEPLRAIPEGAIKTAFAQIIGEPTVPKDWGGERSDLFSSRVMLDGARISAAFAFKGPAQFRPMTVAQLGKNGDQIDRLFSEPADLLVLQHCHEIMPPVRAMMRCYAQQMGNPRLFCVIDGYDTLRLLQAYEKCGFTKQSRLQPR